MPTPPYAKLLVSLNAGATTSGGITAANGDTVQLSGESTAQWSSQRFEIYSFHSASEFPCPAGWSVDSNSGSYYYEASTVPPPFTLPAGPAWGKFLLRLTVNKGLNAANQADPTLLDEATALSIPSTSGLKDLAWAEGPQFSTSQKWVADQQENLRTLDNTVGAIATASATVAGVNAGAGTAGAANTFSRGDHAHQVSTGAPSTTIQSDAGVAAVGSATSLLRSDAQIIAGTAAPVTVGTANAQGSSTRLARADHVHSHGAQTTDTLHALAVAGTSHGFLDKADKTKLDAATSAATASTLVLRDASANASFNTADALRVTVGNGGTELSSYLAHVPKNNTYAASIAFDGKNGSRQDVVLTGNVAFAVTTNYVNGAVLEVFVEQGAGAPFTATWATGAGGFVFASGLSGTLIGTAQFDCDYFEFRMRGGKFVCTNHVKYTVP